jgi:hypothetical protein
MMLALLFGLAGCTSKEAAPLHIYRSADAGAAAVPSAPGQHFVVDYRNHDLPKPSATQRWLLQDSAFLLIDAGGRVVMRIPARGGS